MCAKPQPNAHRLHAAETICFHVRSQLASVLDDLDNKQAAEELYRAVLTVEPNHLDATYNLALLLQGKEGAFNGGATIGREAISLYRTVLAADASRWDAWANLAAAIENLKEAPMLATKSYQKAIVLLEKEHSTSEPGEAEQGYLAKLYFGFAQLLANFSPSDCAAFAAEESSLLVGDESEATDGLCVQNAMNALRVSLELDPSHVQAEHMLASLAASTGSSPEISKASPAFVKQLFDDFSDSFEEKLAALQYSVPALVGERLAAYVRSARAGRSFASAMDAGCGTGLAGPHLRPLVDGSLVGVDLSPKMLKRAAELADASGRRVYDRLLSEDLLGLQRADVLTSPREAAAGLEVIAAADVLVYFGELTELMGVFDRLSAPSSVLAFSCEKATADEAPNGWLIRKSGRFAHTREYVQVLAAAVGFEIVSYEDIVPRIEHGQPVSGHLFVLRRGNA